MISKSLLRDSLVAGIVVALASATSPFAVAQLNSGQPQILSTNQTITPLAPRGASFQPLNPNLADNPTYTVGQAVTTVVSPDKKTLLILTSGYNSVNYSTGPNAGSTNPTDSTEWIFVFDISSTTPVQKQAIPVPNTYSGIVFNPKGTEFYVSGGDNDNVHIYDLVAGLWSEVATPVSLGHLALANPALGNYGGIGLITPPEAAGIAISQDGTKIVVANYENDSISVLSNTGSGWSKTAEYDLRPGKINPAQTGVAGGEFPFWVQIKGNDTAYISCIRDREIDVVSISGAPSLVTRIKVTGNPNKSVLSPGQGHLYVAEDNSDSIAVIDTASNTLAGEISGQSITGAAAGAKSYGGAQVNSVALSPDGELLYATLAGQNAVAVIENPSTPSHAELQGLIPTGFYPNSVSTSADGKQLFIVNGKSATGPNPQNCVGLTPAQGVTCSASNQYIWQLTKAGFQTLPKPQEWELKGLTAQVLKNNNFFRGLTPQQTAKMAALRNKIQHVIYIIKENRTYDQILGDLPVGNGDPNLTQFGQAITPNFHAIASKFVDFDNFYDVSDVSGDGWPWSTSARTTDVIEKEIPPNYAGRGLDNDSEGTNRNLNIGIGNFIQRYEADPLDGADPNVLPGTANVAGPDSPEGGQGEGYLWNSALAAGKTVRDYGMFVDIARYNLPASLSFLNIPEDPTAFQDGVQVAYSTSPALAPFTDPYYRGFDNSFPDYFRYTEWKREFDQYNASGNLPNLSLVRIMHDHTGNFGTAINGVNTVELQQADNDYAVGLLVDAVAHSQFKNNTLIFVIEDDAQDGGDHVDAHRSTAYIVGPYVKHGVVDSSRYNTVSMLRTIEDVLGIDHLSLNDVHATPMVDAFDLSQKDWNFHAVPSTYLMSTTLPIPTAAYNSTVALKSMHDAAWWAEKTKGFDFSVEDHLDTEKYNRVVWEGTMGNKPYPTTRSGADLRANRAELLKSFREAQASASANDTNQQNSAAAPADKGGN